MVWTDETVAKALSGNPDLAAANKTRKSHAQGGGDRTMDNINHQVERSMPSGVDAQASKYRVSAKKDRTYGGKVYASKKEARKAQELDLRVKAGDIDFYLEQVPFRLPGGAKHLVDFVTFTPASFDEEGNFTWTWYIEFIEVKGKDLALGKLKRRQVEELYHITITVE